MEDSKRSTSRSERSWDERHQHLRTGVFFLDIDFVAFQHRRDDPVAEHVVELVGGAGDVVHPGQLVRQGRVLPDLLDHVHHMTAGCVTEHEVALVPEDDGVRLVLA